MEHVNSVVMKRKDLPEKISVENVANAVENPFE